MVEEADNSPLPPNVHLIAQAKDEYHVLIKPPGTQNWDPEEDLFETVAVLSMLNGGSLSTRIVSSEEVFNDDGTLLGYHVVFNPIAKPPSLFNPGENYDQE